MSDDENKIDKYELYAGIHIYVPADVWEDFSDDEKEEYIGERLRDAKPTIIEYFDAALALDPDELSPDTGDTNFGFGADPTLN